MRFVRILLQDRVHWGSVQDDQILLLEGSPFDEFTFTHNKVALAEPGVKILSPVEPSKIICVGLNYYDHTRELKMAVPKEPLFFMKAPTSLRNPGEPIVLPPEAERVDYEAELGVVIKKKCRRVAADEALGVIAGYTCVNDVTARDIQRRELQWLRCKSYDTFCPVGPYLVQHLPAAAPANIRCFVNGELRQNSSVDQMIFSVEHLIEEVSLVMTLNPGDLIVTGTPAGVGALHEGDIVSVKIDGLGSLENPVVAGYSDI